MRTYRGMEFRSKEVNKYLQHEGIHHFYAINTGTKANYAKAIIKNLKKRLFRNMLKKRTQRYINVLKNIVQGYNRTINRSLGRRPIDLMKENEGESRLQQYLLRTKGGSKIVEMEGPLHIDLFQQPKLLINGVSVGIKLHRDTFTLITDALSPDFRVKIVDAHFRLCIQRLSSCVLVAHDRLIQDTPASYPYLRTDIKTTSIASGQFSYSADDIFQGLVPSKLIVGLVPSAAFNGDYTQNPFNLKHYNCSSIGLYVDG
ncbi:uncharacterized protein F54H12.2-like [Mercenaria mercenaria]|uniref:uncharacterized protein F54H12.2-like n=1 Tax=Mercenaria mercenaria TaxID=6596 RepID=UPI001E1E0F65|nr:uncharacterized protein F54H12.2-like [Mercenaria mercenaria]